MNVLIVESAAKTKTIQKYLGNDWRVLATGGHVETLPQDREAHGKDGGKAYWSNRPGQLPSPPWVWTERGEKAVTEILKAGGNDPVFWIATDPDREGEFIAWCLDRLLIAHGKTRRVTFQEITEQAVLAAIAAPRAVDQQMVDSALVRKFIDRLVGYRLAHLLLPMRRRHYVVPQDRLRLREWEKPVRIRRSHHLRFSSGVLCGGSIPHIRLECLRSGDLLELVLRLRWRGIRSRLRSGGTLLALSWLISAMVPPHVHG